jgi:hypothetical protein
MPPQSQMQPHTQPATGATIFAAVHSSRWPQTMVDCMSDKFSTPRSQEKPNRQTVFERNSSTVSRYKISQFKCFPEHTIQTPDENNTSKKKKKYVSAAVQLTCRYFKRIVYILATVRQYDQRTDNPNEYVAIVPRLLDEFLDNSQR